jgi:preprotein translocase subunit SecE
MSTNVQQEGSSSALDIALYVLAAVIAAVGIYGNSVYANEYSVFYRALALLPMALVAGFALVKTSKGGAFFKVG